MKATLVLRPGDVCLGAVGILVLLLLLLVAFAEVEERWRKR